MADFDRNIYDRYNVLLKSFFLSCFIQKMDSICVHREREDFLFVLFFLALNVKLLVAFSSGENDVDPNAHGLGAGRH